MSARRLGLPRWVWLLVIGASVLILLVELLLRDGSEGEADAERGAAGRGANGRLPFPKQGEFSGVRRPRQIEPRENSAADPWQQGRKRE